MNQRQLDEFGEGLKEFRRVQRKNDETDFWVALALLGLTIAFIILLTVV